LGQTRHSLHPTVKAFGLVGLMASALILSACQTKTASLETDPLATGSLSGAPSFKRTDALSKQWKADPTNIATALAYSTNLEQLDQKDSQFEMLRTTSAQTRGDVAAQTKVGKAQLAAGDVQGASETLQRAVELNPGDAQLHSVLGATLDQLTKHSEAREQHQAALALAPEDLSVLNNAAMSFALQGKLAEAEAILRKAAAHPNAKAIPRVRQNLALVVGLQGRFDEAKQIASEDLPPDQVQANMDYLQQMLARKNTWAQLKEG
jgi:Flp pilus assembly protein TadD